MAYVEVDVDLDTFDLEDILEYIDDEISYSRTSNSKRIREWLNEKKIENNLSTNMCLVDQMKVDFLINNIHKISINDLENLIK